MDIVKNLYNSGKQANLFFYRDSNGLEADLLLPRGRDLIPVEIKSSATYRPELLKGLTRITALSPRLKTPTLVYAGNNLTFSNGVRALRFDDLKNL